jgi:hypothetical protein
MIIIYRTRPSNGARDLVESLGNCRRGRENSVRAPRFGDKVVCWGDSLNLQGIEVLNGVPIINKYEDAVKLKAANVPTVEVSRTRPANQGGGFAPRPNYRPTAVQTTDGTLTEAQVRTALQLMNSYLQAPLTPLPSVEWLGRKFNHVGGGDLLSTQSSYDYWSKKEDLIEEYRVHSFLGKSIRAGKKVQGAEGVSTVHPWIRSHDGGWHLAYDGFSSTKEMRKLAKQAVEALGLNFGAVDIGKTREGKLIVLEVNRAPGLEGGTINAYSDAISKWYRGEFEVESEDRRAA